VISGCNPSNLSATARVVISRAAGRFRTAVTVPFFDLDLQEAFVRFIPLGLAHMSTTLELKPALAAARGRLATRTITTLQGLADLELPWRLLGEEHGGPMEHFDWAMACASSSPQCGLQCFAVTRGDRLVAVAPMGLRRIHGASRRVMLGVEDYFELTDLLASDAEALKQLTAAMARHRRPLLLGRLPADTPSLPALRKQFAKGWLVLERPQAACPFIPLDASWSEPEAHLNSGRRSDLRRAQRKAEKLGRVVAEVLSPRVDELGTLLDEAFRVESLSWKGCERSSLVCDPAREAFYRRYARAACRQGMLRLCFLRIGGRAVAMQMAMVAGGGFWLLKIGYDAEYSQCSPGTLLLRESIAYAARAGLRSFEFLGQSEPWIELWTSHKHACVSLRIYPWNLRGAAALAADTAVKLADAARQRVRRAKAGLRSVTTRCLLPLLKRAARNYIAGETLADALDVKQRLAQQGFSATMGYWNSDDDSARAVADQYLAGLDAMARDGPENYLSIKLPALQFSAELLAEVVQRGCATGRRVHFDALEPKAADRTRAMVDDVLTAAPAAQIGFTLPGRWKRSLDDARWAAERGLFVRVVKGQWPDPSDPKCDMTAGYLEVIDRLAGRARHVAVATHDPALAAEAVRRLRAAGTPCDLELLYGLPMRKSLRHARNCGIPVRLYVPYGTTYLPYALSQVRRKPGILWWLAKDLVAGAVGVGCIKLAAVIGAS
jgi:CelD/BcsL family acetyltransferase involved in cellulose biosynthesis